jgi:hypothetical protein
MRDKYETTIVQAFADDKNFKNALNSVRQAQSTMGYCSICHGSWSR